MIFHFNTLAPWSPLIYVVLVLVFGAVVKPPIRFLAEQGTITLWDGRISRLFIAGYALGALLLLLAPTPLSLFERVSAVLFLGFMLQLSVLDATAGWLPIEYTSVTAASGLLVMWQRDEQHLWAMAGIGTLFAIVRFYCNYRAKREALGLGDVWLAVALAAWCGWSGTVQALLIGVVGFVLWHACSSSARKEGPLGPWLCAGAMLALINRVFNPVVVF
ncbi:A24 family peptidase [Pectobacterium betavasculorum]|uniref:A24 family peptidase n=1 Tax=Pectobacterium betavasculorum TaxID=55207 RepID=UPI00313A9498